MKLNERTNISEIAVCMRRTFMCNSVACVSEWMFSLRIFFRYVLFDVVGGSQAVIFETVEVEQLFWQASSVALQFRPPCESSAVLVIVFSSISTEVLSILFRAILCLSGMFMFLLRDFFQRIFVVSDSRVGRTFWLCCRRRHAVARYRTIKVSVLEQTTACFRLGISDACQASLLHNLIPSRMSRLKVMTPPATATYLSHFPRRWKGRNTAMKWSTSIASWIHKYIVMLTEENIAKIDVTISNWCKKAISKIGTSGSTSKQAHRSAHASATMYCRPDCFFCFLLTSNTRPLPQTLQTMKKQNDRNTSHDELSPK